MDTTTTICQKSALLKISNGISIYREGSFRVPAQPKSPLKQPLFIIGIVGIAVSSIIISFPILAIPASGSFAYTTRSAPSTVLSEQPSRPTGHADLRLPVRLKIPIINVNALLESVGLTSQGEVGVPKGPTNAAWFNLGPRPGENGDSVIDGHFGWWKNGTQAVFNNLDKLHKGDKLYVEDQSGATTAFVVREIRRYDPNANAPEVFGSNDGKAHLNLITCDGVWNNTQKSYPNRLVVFTDKEME